MKLKSFIFCDDIRQEINGKVSLIGVYDDSVLFSVDKGNKGRWPKSQKMGIYCEIEMDEILPIKSFELVLVVDEVKKVIGNGVLQSLKDTAKKIKIVIIHSPFVFEKAGNYSFLFRFFDDSKKLLEEFRTNASFKVSEKIV